MEKTVSEVISESGGTVVNVCADGCCAGHSIAICLKNKGLIENDVTGQNIRHILCDCLNYSENHRMREKTTWFDEIMFIEACKLFLIKICIIFENGENMLFSNNVVGNEIELNNIIYIKANGLNSSDLNITNHFDAIMLDYEYETVVALLKDVHLSENTIKKVKSLFEIDKDAEIAYNLQQSQSIFEQFGNETRSYRDVLGNPEISQQIADDAAFAQQLSHDAEFAQQLENETRSYRDVLANAAENRISNWRNHRLD